MKIYFLSSQPCALTLNGVFYGVTDTFERSAELSLGDKIYAKFSPEGKLPVGFFITEEILSKPPDGCEVYLLKEGIALYACDFATTDCTLHPIAQKREGKILATVYAQGKLQLSVDSPQGFFNATLPPSFTSCEVFFHRDHVLLKGADNLGVFNLQCQPLLIERVEEYALTEEGLSATLPLSDLHRRKARCQWRLQENECKMTEFTLTQAENKESAADDNLLAYAFFESVLIGADFKTFLSDELQIEGEEIVRFLGDFIAVTFTKEPTVCGLVRKKAPRLFAVDYVGVEIANGKITDVKG